MNRLAFFSGLSFCLGVFLTTYCVGVLLTRKLLIMTEASIHQPLHNGGTPLQWVQIPPPWRVPSKYPNESAAICIMMKDQESSVDEWVDFHYYVAGFDHFYIYDNSDMNFMWQWAEERNQRGEKLMLKETGTRARLPIITLKHWPDRPGPKQWRAHQDCAMRFASKHTWLFFCDGDEFLVFRGKHEGSHVVDFLHDNFNRSVGAVGFNWIVFGTAGRLMYEPAPFTKRFQYHLEISNEMNRHVKSIVRTEALDLESKVQNPHWYPLRKGFVQVSGGGTPMEVGPFNPAKDVDDVALYHYKYRSVKEYAAKGLRGRGSSPTPWVSTVTEALNRPTENGTIFDDLAWRLLKRHVPWYAFYDQRHGD